MTSISKRIYIPPSIHTPCKVSDSWDGLGPKPSRLTSDSDRAANKLGATKDKTSATEGKYFGTVTKVCDDYWQSPYNTVNFKRPPGDKFDAHGINSILLIRDPEGLKIACTSTWRPGPERWILAPQSAMVDVEPSEGSGFKPDQNMQDTVYRGIYLKTGYTRDRVKELYDDGVHYVHPGIEDTIRHTYYHLVESEEVVKRDGSNLPIKIPTRQDAREGDERPLHPWDTTVCLVQDLTYLVEKYQHGEFSGVDATLTNIHMTASEQGQVFDKWLVKQRERQEERRERRERERKSESDSGNTEAPTSSPEEAA